MEILDLLRDGRGNGVTLYELQMMTGMPERAVRQEIERLRRCHPIVNMQGGRVYCVSHDARVISDRELPKTQICSPCENCGMVCPSGNTCARWREWFRKNWRAICAEIKRGKEG